MKGKAYGVFKSIESVTHSYIQGLNGKDALGQDGKLQGDASYLNFYSCVAATCIVPKLSLWSSRSLEYPGCIKSRDIAKLR